MSFLSRLKLLVLEQKLYYGAFGKYNRYQCRCLKQNATTTAEKLRVARQVLQGPRVNTMEAQYNELFIKRHASEKAFTLSNMRQEDLERRLHKHRDDPKAGRTWEEIKAHLLGSGD